MLPGIGAAAAAAMIAVRLRHPSRGRRNGTDGHRDDASPPSASLVDARAALVPLVGAAAVLVVVPVPTFPAPLINNTADTGDHRDHRASDTVVPPGWEEIGRTDYPWAERYFGEGSELTRQSLRATTVVDDWDSQGRLREVMVDSLSTPGSLGSRLFGEESLYTTVGGRRSVQTEVDLGPGVVGTMYTVLDDEKYLTYTRLRVFWGPVSRPRGSTGSR